MELPLFTQVSLIIAITAAVTGLLRLLRQPLIVGYIISGVLLGPTLLNIFSGEQETFSAFSSFGIALLLFIIGLGLNAEIIRRLGKVVFAVSFVQIALTVLVGGLVALAFGLTPIAAAIVGLALSFSSTIIIIKILGDKREHSQLYGQVTIGILLVQDIVASIALLFLAANQGDSPGVQDLALLAAKGLVLLLGLTIVATKLLPLLNRFVAGSQEFLFLFALAWGFGVATLFDVSGFSIEVGALFAGVSLAALPYSQEMAARLKPLRDFFVVIFFVALGSRLHFENMLTALPMSIALSLVVLVVKPLIVLMTLGALAYTKRTGFKAALALGQLSEFSLVLILLAAHEGLVPEAVGSTLTLTALITIAISTYLMKYDDQLFRSLNRGLQLFERRVVRTEREKRSKLQTYPIVLFGYYRGGTEFIRAFKKIGKPFVVVDYDPEVIERLKTRSIAYRYGDAADPELLEELGIEKAHLIVSTITEYETNLALVRYVGTTNRTATIICHADTHAQAVELYALGATLVILPHYISSVKISHIIERHGLSKHEFKLFHDRELAALSHQHDDLAGQK